MIVRISVVIVRILEVKDRDRKVPQGDGLYPAPHWRLSELFTLNGKRGP